MKKLLKSPAMLSVLGFILAAYLRFVWWTCRFEKVDWDPVRDRLRPGRPVILAFWHGRMAMMSFARPKDAPVYQLISNHTDGEVIARTVGHLGVISVRGSSAKKNKKEDKGGAKALRAMLKLLKGDICVSITPDGPRGPRNRVSEGTIVLARLSGAVILPVSFSVSRRRLFSSWDRFTLPLPFARGIFIAAEPIEVPRDLDEGQIEETRRRLEKALNRITDEADRRMGHEPFEPGPPLRPELADAAE